MSERKIVADLAKQLRRDEITFEMFLDGVPEDTEDDTVAELIDMIEHEPKRGGFLGVSSSEHTRYVDRIDALIEELLK